MISFRDVSHTVQEDGRHQTFLERFSLDLPTDRKLGILVSQPAHTGILVRLLAGLEKPTSGTIDRYVHLSFPVAYEGIYKRHLSPRQNLEHLRYVFGDRIDEIINSVASVTAMGDLFDVGLGNLPPDIQRRFVFATSYVLPFDCYLFDEKFSCGPSDEEFRAKCLSMFQARAAAGGIIFVSTRIQILARFCNVLAKHQDGRISFMRDAPEGSSKRPEELLNSSDTPHVNVVV